MLLRPSTASSVQWEARYDVVSADVHCLIHLLLLSMVRIRLMNQVIHSLLGSNLLLSVIFLGVIAPTERWRAPHNPVDLLGGGLVTEEFSSVKSAHEGLIMWRKHWLALVLGELALLLRLWLGCRFAIKSAYQLLLLIPHVKFLPKVVWVVASMSEVLLRIAKDCGLIVLLMLCYDRACNIAIDSCD